MVFPILILIIAFSYEAIKHYESTAKYNFQFGEDTPFFGFMMRNHPFVTIVDIVLSICIVYIAFRG